MSKKESWPKTKKTSQLSNKKKVLAHLSADKELKKETVSMLIQMIDTAYKTK